MISAVFSAIVCGQDALMRIDPPHDSLRYTTDPTTANKKPGRYPQMWAMRNKISHIVNDLCIVEGVSGGILYC